MEILSAEDLKPLKGRFKSSGERFPNESGEDLKNFSMFFLRIDSWFCGTSRI
jgi:hypothetical protein